jgi:hypothetical protein
MDEVWEAPGDDSTLDEKLRFQRKLRSYLEEPWKMFEPWIKDEHGNICPPGHRWWHTPWNPPDSVIAKRQKRQIERQLRQLSQILQRNITARKGDAIGSE